MWLIGSTKTISTKILLPKVTSPKISATRSLTSKSLIAKFLTHLCSIPLLISFLLANTHAIAQNKCEDFDPFANNHETINSQKSASGSNITYNKIVPQTPVMPTLQGKAATEFLFKQPKLKDLATLFKETNAKSLPGLFGFSKIPSLFNRWITEIGRLTSSSNLIRDLSEVFLDLRINKMVHSFSSESRESEGAIALYTYFIDRPIMLKIKVDKKSQRGFPYNVKLIFQTLATTGSKNPQFWPILEDYLLKSPLEKEVYREIHDLTEAEISGANLKYNFTELGNRKDLAWDITAQLLKEFNPDNPSLAFVTSSLSQSMMRGNSLDNTEPISLKMDSYGSFFVFIKTLSQVLTLNEGEFQKIRTQIPMSKERKAARDEIEAKAATERAKIQAQQEAENQKITKLTNFKFALVRHANGLTEFLNQLNGYRKTPKTLDDKPKLELSDLNPSIFSLMRILLVIQNCPSISREPLP
jgi:hypothetical protein